MEGVGQLANHTCCDAHWNANLEVAAIDHHEETAIEPMGILRARQDIEQDTEILTRYWHTKKDAWHNIFECQCCACTNHTGNLSDPLTTADTAVVGDAISGTDHFPRIRRDPEELKHVPNQDNSAGSKQKYPESEIDDWDWDELEASPSKGTTTSTQPPMNLAPLSANDGATRGPEYEEDPSHGLDTLHNTSQPTLGSILETIVSIPRQSFPETWHPTVGTLITVYTGGDAQIWRVHHIRQGVGTSITIKHGNSDMTVDMSWIVFDINIGSLVLQRLGFFSDTELKRTTNSIEVWRDILNPDKMMNGEALMVLLEWTINGSPRNDNLGLPEAQSKTWLVDRSFWQSWEHNNEPQPVPWGKCTDWVCIEREPIWGTEVTRHRLCKLLDICFSTDMQDIDPKDGGLVQRCALPDQDRPNTDLDGTQLMNNDYIKGTKGHYMPKDSFLYLRKYERMIEKIIPPTLIHLLDHIIIPIHIRKSHWFPAHINLQTRSISLLDSSQGYSAADYPQQRMLIWKFFRMIWTSHVSAVAPGPYWTIPPDRFIGPHPGLTDLTSVMMQTLDTTNDHIKTR